MQYRFITIEGPIGVGKTTFVEMLAERLRLRTIFDAEGNPFIGEFYDGAPGSALKAQLYFLLARHQLLANAKQPGLYEQGTISDFLFEKDRLFAHLNLNEDELSIYEKLFALLNERLPKPDLVIYLTAPVEVLMKRIRSRSRGYERKLSESYLAGVAAAYTRHFHHYKGTPLIVVNTQDIDFVKHPQDAEDLIQKIERHKGGVMYYTPQSQV
jgi:deoxyguanosine kinase